jgi:hypothetical protein
VINKLRLVFCFFAFLLLPIIGVLANGGAWQIGVPLTGNAAPSDKSRTTEVAIEEENLTIDLHQEFAAVEVRYRMRNTGPKVVQDFFFPVERWTQLEGEEMGEKPANLEGYRITADNAELKAKEVTVPQPKKAQPTPEPEPTAEESNEQSTNDEQLSPEQEAAQIMADFPPPTKLWKKSEIPFAADQTREIVVRFRARYSGYERGVSDDSHGSDKVLVYSLSPAATWKGPIGRGRIVVNVLHPRPEEVAIEKPRDRFQKVSDTRYEWEFTNLEPTLDDDLKIVAHRAYHSYFAGNTTAEEGDPIPRSYIVQGDRYFLEHADYNPVASSTLPPSKKGTYDVNNIKKLDPMLPWSEGAEGDGIGESITLDVTRPLPLDAITIVPGYHSYDDASLWTKNNRVAELEVTLNGAKTFTVKIPDEQFKEPYPIPVRDFAEPVKNGQADDQSGAPRHRRARHLHLRGPPHRQAGAEAGVSARAVKRRFALLLAACALITRVTEAQIALPIYIEDNHAGSFYWLAEHLDLDEPVTLLHFDAHSDASGVFDSDAVRRQLRRVASRGDRAERLQRWRRSGTVQCYNWIEPLMPSPIAEVIWIPREASSGADNHSLGAEAGDLLDGHLEAAPRAEGELRSRYRVMGLEQLREEFVDDKPLVATIDLDYFAGMTAPEREAAFERVWSFIAQRRNLRAVTIAISRPYLTGDEEADALVQLALRASLSLPTARVQFEPFQTVANDRSRRAEEYRAQKIDVPVYDVSKASPELRALLLARTDRIGVRFDHPRWLALLKQWRAEAPAVRLAIKDRQPSTDNIWRVPANLPAEITLQTEPWYAQPDRVTWIAEQPLELRCNLTASRADEPGFAQGAPPRPRYREIPLVHEGATLSLDQLRNVFDAQTGCGAVRLFARIAFGGSIRETPAIEIRRTRGTGFRAALLEQFGLPYLFGSGGLRDGPSTGPETGWGADCANFLIYALRRSGHRVPWSDPKQLRRHLELVAKEMPLSGAAVIDPAEIELGLFVHLGAHVAAVMEDRPPLGQLDATDLVAHQLEGAPELLELGELLRRRSRTTFDLLRVPVHEQRADVLLGGDVMLGRSIGPRVAAGADPFAGIAELLRKPGLKLANLECVVSAKGTPALGRRYHLAAPVTAAPALARAGFNGVGLANNHALDFGGAALLDSIRRLRAARLAVIGAGPQTSSAYAAHHFTTASNRKIAVIAVDDTAPAGNDGRAIVANAANRTELQSAIAAAREQAEVVLALVIGAKRTVRSSPNGSGSSPAG